jgi:hypothetical protein
MHQCKNSGYHKKLKRIWNEMLDKESKRKCVSTVSHRVAKDMIFQKRHRRKSGNVYNRKGPRD